MRFWRQSLSFHTRNAGSFFQREFGRSPKRRAVWSLLSEAATKPKAWPQAKRILRRTELERNEPDEKLKMTDLDLRGERTRTERIRAADENAVWVNSCGGWRRTTAYGKA